MSHGLQSLLRVERNTCHLDRAVAFHRDALGFRVDDADAPPPAWTSLPGIATPPTRTVQLSLGAQRLELTEFPDAVPYSHTATACDTAFQHCALVVSDIDAVQRRALQHGAAPITQGGPQTLPPSTGSVIAWKFRDPDGHPLELIRFPPGTGDPAWQRAPAGTAALGIDHTAISVMDVARSVRFYRLLGLDVAARGVNHGVAQQHLDDLVDVEVDVLALQACARTPHLELLGYRNPQARISAATRTDAVAADRSVWKASNITMLLDALTDADCTDTIIASGVVHGATLALLRDPDGHRLVLTESA